MSEYSEVLYLDTASVNFDHRTVLKDVHISINAGEFCYLRGETASGKSSLIKAIYGMLPMTGGRIYAVGQDLSELNRNTLPAYRRRLGLVADYYGLFGDLTVYKNLDTILSVTDWPIASEREKRINDILDHMDIGMLKEEKVNDLPSGLRQKVSIARSVLNKPALILADNPMVHLDTKSIDDVMELFIDLVKEYKSSLLCTISDDSLINRYPARSYYCADGTVTESR